MIVDCHGYICHMYCYIEMLCSSGRVWMSVVYLNMTNSSEKCPDGFRLYNQNGLEYVVDLPVVSLMICHLCYYIMQLSSLLSCLHSLYLSDITNPYIYFIL